MDVCIVGGIFDRDAAHRRIHTDTPETILADGLVSRGVRVRTVGHSRFMPRTGEIVHVHHIGRGAIVSVSDLRIAGVVLTPHDGRLVDGARFQPVRRRVAWRIAARWCDALVALSSREARQFQHVIDDSRIFTIPNGTPFVPAAATPDEATPDEATPYLLFVGQLIPLKGVTELISAFAQLAGEFNALDLRLAYHNAQEESGLRALAEHLGIAARVHFLGPQDPESLRRLYRGAICTVLPSYAEALPSVLIEAQLQGCAVISTDVGGIPDIVRDRRQLVKPGDIEALARVIRTTLQVVSTETRSAREERSLRMRREYGVEQMIDAHIALYQRVPALRRHPFGRSLLSIASSRLLPASDLP